MTGRRRERSTALLLLVLLGVGTSAGCADDRGTGARSGGPRDRYCTVVERFGALDLLSDEDPVATNLDRGFIEYANSPEVGALYVRLQVYQGRTCGPDPRSEDPDLA